MSATSEPNRPSQPLRPPSTYRAEDFLFDLPQELIAAYPLAERSASRLMVVRRDSQTIEHHQFVELPQLLRADDLLVLNDTRVRLSRVFSIERDLEILLLEELAPRRWLAMAKPGRRARTGARFRFLLPVRPAAVGREAPREEIGATVEDVWPDGERIFLFDKEFCADEAGFVPLPPYIRKRREGFGSHGQAIVEESPAVAPQGFVEEERYQTVYAREAGSSAAPTAGLHFTPELLARLNHAFVTLHVGAGTFRPLRTPDITEHLMHEEPYSVPAGLAEKAVAAGRLVAVGTTSARVLESAPTLEAHTGRTAIYIYPPYKFKRVDALITNFHLPDTTLMLLVCAFGGKELMLNAYREAVRERYRFFSYGDAMLIL